MPLVISLPGGKTKKVDTAVSLLDVYPTLVALAGLPENGDNEGQNLISIVETKTDLDRAILTTSSETYHAVRDGRYRYIRAVKAEALFDHENDPREFDNIAGNPGSAAIIRRLSKVIPKYPHASMPKKK